MVYMSEDVLALMRGKYRAKSGHRRIDKNEVGNVFIASGLDNLLEAHDMLTDEARHINEICLRTGYKRRIVRGLIKRGRISIESDGSVTVHCGSSESPSLTQTEQTNALLVES